MAQGKYIAYLDDDDIFYPDHIETLVIFLESSDYKVAYTDAFRAHQTLQEDKYVVTQRDGPLSFDFDYNRILYQNFVPVLCFMHQKSCLEELGGFDEMLKRHEDWDMWIRMSREFKMAHIKKSTCEYTYRRDGSSMTSGRKAEFRKTCEMIFEKHKHLTAGNPNILKQQTLVRSRLRAEEALELAREGDVSGGIVLLEECLGFDPDNAQTHNFLGQLYMLRANSTRALAHLEKAVELCRYDVNFRKSLDKALKHFFPDRIKGNYNILRRQ